MLFQILVRDAEAFTIQENCHNVIWRLPVASAYLQLKAIYSVCDANAYYEILLDIRVANAIFLTSKKVGTRCKRAPEYLASVTTLISNIELGHYNSILL